MHQGGKATGQLLGGGVGVGRAVLAMGALALCPSGLLLTPFAHPPPTHATWTGPPDAQDAHLNLRCAVLFFSCTLSVRACPASSSAATPPVEPGRCGRAPPLRAHGAGPGAGHMWVA
jgi:hypothetical protein